MSEEEIKTRRISLRIGGKDPIPIIIPRDTAEEKALRNAATEINRLFPKYRNAYPSASDEEIITYVAIHLARRLSIMQEEFQELDLSATISDLLSEIDHSTQR